MSLQRYEAVQNQTETPRQTEYRLFALVTKELMSAEQSGDKDRVGAVDWNRRLWLTLQMDLASSQNSLPDELKARLISISIWVDKYSRQVLRGEAKVEPLISVNRTIMEGLL
jgi:flagellar protein FlaF